MNDLTLSPITTAEEKSTFIREVQEAFQLSYEEVFGKYEKTILPLEDIEESFAAEGACGYVAEVSHTRVGGAIVAIDEATGFHSLHLLYVCPGVQNAGYGHRIWQAIEAMYPRARLWETHTLCYDKRNIHFYVNRCGFRIVEFFHPGHPDPHQQGDTAGNIPPENNYFFRFEKAMT